MYSLNAAAARQGDTFGAYITETGAYSGRFTRAEKLVSRDKGTHGIGFTFKGDDGREARFDVWTQKADGTGLSGLNTINAMMACLQIRELRDSVVSVTKYDYDRAKDVVVNAPCFTALMNADIGVLLRAEEYEKFNNGAPTGETGWKMGLFGVFQSHTGLMASEILERKTTPELLSKVIASALRDKPLRKRSGNGAQTSASSGRNQTAADDFQDQDIPF